MPDYKKFFEYWHDLYGTGLKIAGWHLNGELEDFDKFMDDADIDVRQNTIQEAKNNEESQGIMERVRRCADESRNRMYRSCLVRVPKRHTP